MKKPLIILTGPTAVGKTKLSIELAKKIGGEIISASTVRALLKAGETEKARAFIPKSCQAVFTMIIGNKQW